MGLFRNNANRRIPLGVFILLVGIVGMFVVIIIFSFTMKLGHFSLVKNANENSEYLTEEQVRIDADFDDNLPTLAPTAEPTEEVTSAPTDSLRIEIAKYATLQFGDSNSDVAALNSKLMELGYMDYDDISSDYTNSTENAVKLFQRANDLDQTGIATNELQELLYDTNAQPYLAKINDDGADIRSAQLRLYEMGYYTDKVSGYYGPQTELAVSIFQAKNKLDVDGKIDRNVFNILYSDEAVWLVTPTPVPTPTPDPTSAATKKPGTTRKPGSSSTSKPGSNPTPTRKPSGGGGGSYGSGVSGMIACAEAHLGYPYVYGDEGPDSFDCSGFVYFCLKKAGASVSRTSAASYAKKSSWRLIENISDLKRGDLIFWKSDTSDRVSHVGISLGGTGFIHASSSKGMVVRSYLTGYWVRNFVCGRRVFG